MQAPLRKAVVIGDGGWGTTIALLLVENGIETTLWSAFPEQVKALREERENRRYLPGVELPEDLSVSADPFEAGEGAEVAFSVVPTQFLRGAIERFEDALPGDTPVVSATKGIEIETFHTPSEILSEVLGERPLGVLSGPSHAEEVARGLPASIVMASADDDLARRVQLALSNERFRIYTHGDPKGAELGGALKNVIAIAAGISDGLELGDNAKAALLTRGIIEMARFGEAHGARSETFFGLAGLGDLATTCYSRHSRNRHVGEEIGRGKSLEEVLDEMEMVAEGVWTTRALFGPESEARGVSMPIAEQVNAVLFDGKDPRQGVTELMQREPVGEMDGLGGASR
ncbi:MAG TPA: NAD(P)-dependent glycerol-3-phosphate dehydrogenase [Planctomycetes bacterium]|nr:NAD(P)-dependent glycerol-3-phosphate dehydrogenase [Planctomycetota bacterium]